MVVPPRGYDPPGMADANRVSRPRSSRSLGERNSSGMRARLGFAIATDKRPDILLVDEVLAVGDAEFRRRCEKRIEEYQEIGMTVLIVSHATQILERMCTRVIWLDGGRLVAEGEPSDVVKRYAENMGD